MRYICRTRLVGERTTWLSAIAPRRGVPVEMDNAPGVCVVLSAGEQERVVGELVGKEGRFTKGSVLLYRHLIGGGDRMAFARLARREGKIALHLERIGR